MRAYRIYLIRHGMTAANLEARYVGVTDYPLCDEGMAGLLELQQNYDYPNVQAVYSSPMTRCVQTAKVLYRDLTPIVVPQLREYDFGCFEGMTLQELKDDPRFRGFIGGRLSFFEEEWGDSETKMENIEEFNARIIKGLDNVIRDMMKQKISDAAVVTHGGVIMQLLAMCGLPKQKADKWAVHNGKGYTLLVNASLWANTQTAEVFSALPLEKLPPSEDDE